MIIFLKDRNIRVPFLGKMESRREAKGTTSNDDDRVGLGNAHDGKSRMVFPCDHGDFACLPDHIYPATLQAIQDSASFAR